MKKILITGSKGQLGNELKCLSVKYPQFEFEFTDIEELDITNPKSTKEYFEKSLPEVVVNCAAYTAVDKAESERDEAWKLNVEAVENLARLSAQKGFHLIHISTDYVFNGKNFRPYNETDPREPVSWYGTTKAEAEKRVELFAKTATIIRTSWLYSAHGHNFVKTILRLLRDRKSIQVVFDQAGSPTYAQDLAECILVLAQTNPARGISIYNYSNEGVCSWYDFAIAISEHAALPCDIVPVTSDKYKTAAVRPHYSVMDKEKIRKDLGISIPHWRESLSRCIEKLIKQEY